MNLYLSSYRLGNHPEAFRDMVGDNKKTAVIVNAMDVVSTEDRQRGVERELADIKSLGLEPEELDLRQYFAAPERLQETLHGYGAIWVRGGNAFLLRQAMEKSGLDKLLVKRLYADPTFVYAGYSAGVVVIGPSLEGIELVDDQHVRADGYDTTAIWRGVGLVEYSVVPHYKSDHPESAAIDGVVSYYQAHEMPYKTLHDGEAIVIQDDTETIVGTLTSSPQ